MIHPNHHKPLPCRGLFWIIAVILLLQQTPCRSAEPPAADPVGTSDGGGLKETSSTSDPTTPTLPTTTTEPTTTEALTTTVEEPTTTPPDLTPQNLRLVSRDETTIVVEWDATQETTYEVTCRPLSNGEACKCEKEVWNRYKCGDLAVNDRGKVFNITVLPVTNPPPLPCQNCSLLVLSKPGPPKKVKTSPVNETAIEITWDPPLAGLEFTYYIQTEGVRNATTKAQSHIVGGLQTSKEYTISITSQVSWEGDTTVSSSEIRKAWTNPAQVTGLSIDPKEYSLTLSWERTADDGTVNSYVVLTIDKVDGTCVQETRLGQGDATHNCANYTHIDLPGGSQFTTEVGWVEPCSGYTVIVYATNEGGGQGQNSTEDTRTQIAEPTEKVKIESVTPAANSIKVSWETATPPGRCSIKNYIVEYTYSNCTTSEVQVRNKTENAPILSTNLVDYIQPYWNYTISVSARTDEGPGNSTSEERNVQTLMTAPGKVTSFNVTQEEGKAILTWDEPVLCEKNGPIDEYRVTYNCKNKANVTDSESGTPELTEEPHWELTTKPYRKCMFSVAAINGPEPGPETVVEHDTPEEGPSKVEGVTVTGTDKTWIALSWKVPSAPNGNITNYIVEYTVIGFIDGQIQPNTDTKNISTIDDSLDLNVTGLHEYTTYRFRLAGVTAGGLGELSAPLEVNTTIGDPLPVQTVKAVSDKRSIRVSWDVDRRTGPTKYRVEVTDNAGNKTDRTVEGFNTTETTVEGLVPFTKYSITVFTVMETGEARADGDSATTKTDKPGPVDVPNANFTSTNTSIWVQWLPPKEPNGEILQYSIEYVPKGYADGVVIDPLLPVPEVLEPLNTTDTIYEIKALKPFTLYEISIYGWTSEGKGTFSPKVNQSTNPGDPMVVSNISVVPDKRTLTVSWKRPANKTGRTQYIILAKDLQFGEDLNKTVENYTTEMSVIDDAKPFRQYNVSVTTQHEDGSESDVVYYGKVIKTKEDAPSGKPTLKLYNITHNCTAKTLKWDPLERKDRNGIITNYTINITDQTSNSKKITVEGNEENGMYEHEVSQLEAGTTYTFEIYASTAAGRGPPTTEKADTGICAPFYPPGESMSEETKMVTFPFASTLKQTELTVSLDRNFFANNENGPITDRYLVVAEASYAGQDPNGTIFDSILKFKDKFSNVWYKVKNQENMEPYRIAINDVFKDPQETSGSMSHNNKRQRRSLLNDPVPFDIGTQDCEGKSQDEECNGQLREGKNYKVRAVACTGGGCTVTAYSAAMETINYPSNSGAIVAGVLVPILLLIIVGGVIGFFMYRKDLGPFAPKECKPVSPSPNGHQNQAFSMESVIQPAHVEPPRPVPLTDFPRHVAERHKNSDLLFSEEYKLVKELSPRMTWNAAELPQNRTKNRYNNILPYDHSRVKLLAIDEDEESGSDYINANFMPGYNSKREFIATQGPLASTKDDFWRLIWEHNVPIVVMVTKCVEKGRHKCEQYWPSDNEPVYYGDLQVQVRSESVLNNYTIRIIDISLGDTKRTVRHFNFETWPDFGCPDTTDALIQFVLTVRNHRRAQDKGPLIIHCSAGVGRTGTFVCVDRLLQQMRDHDTVDVFGTIMEMRRYRTNMVQTEDQYIYIHDCLNDALAQGLHLRYPTNSPQISPELVPPQTKDGDEDQPLYENVEITLPKTEIVPDRTGIVADKVANGNSTGL